LVFGKVRGQFGEGELQGEGRPFFNLAINLDLLVRGGAFRDFVPQEWSVRVEIFIRTFDE